MVQFYAAIFWLDCRCIRHGNIFIKMENASADSIVSMKLVKHPLSIIPLNFDYSIA